jgi:hypothetical protein
MKKDQKRFFSLVYYSTLLMIVFVLQPGISEAQWLLNGNPGGGAWLGTTDNNDLIIKTNSNLDTSNKMTITTTGQVNIPGLLKIGTSLFNGTTTYGTLALSVDGAMAAREIYVNVLSWSDFVFDKDYELMPLEEVNNYITVNHSLPDIPKQKEVEQNGIDVGKMTAKLVQKIEELTLYVIELNKQNQEQKKELELLKEQINKK